MCVKAVKECLGDAESWADMWRASGRHDMAASHVPIIVHEDAVPHFSGFLDLILQTMKQSFFDFCGKQILQSPVLQEMFFECEVPLQQFGAGQLDVSVVTHGRLVNA